MDGGSCAGEIKQMKLVSDGSGSGSGSGSVSCFGRSMENDIGEISASDESLELTGQSVQIMILKQGSPLFRIKRYLYPFGGLGGLHSTLEVEARRWRGGAWDVPARSKRVLHYARSFPLE